MKRIIAALSFTLLAAPVFAADIGAPYEQTVADMALPNVKDPAVTQSDTKPTLFGQPVGLPYEDTVAQMKLPDVKDPVISGQNTVLAGPATPGASAEATGVWANDPNFIDPPQ
jgi:hypothetical protein